MQKPNDVVWLSTSSLIIFLALLPLINSIFDWLSVATTRWLLRHIADGEFGGKHIAFKALADAAIGVALLAALAVTCTAALQTMNLLSQANGGREFFDLAGLLGYLRNDPGNPAVWWVYATLFSTMLPTLAHVVFAASATVTWSMPDRWRQYMQDLVNPELYPLKEKFLKEDFPLRVYAAGLFTLLDATALLLAGAFCLIMYGLFWALPGFGQGLLWLCENVAGWLGVIILTGPAVAV